MDKHATEKLLKHFVEEDAVLRSYVYAATRNYTDAEDVLQEVWQALAIKLDQYDEKRSFRAWALGVARLQVLKWRQAKGRNREIPSSDVLDLLAVTAEEHAEELDVRLSYLQDCMNRLSKSCRKVMEMKYMQDMMISEIAARMGRNVAAIEMTLVRGRRLLRECIEERIQEAKNLKMEV